MKLKLPLIIATLVALLAPVATLRAQPVNPSYPRLANLPIIDIRTEGAKAGDQSVDVINAINAASLKASNAGGGVVMVPALKFYGAPTLNTHYIIARSNVTIRGEGWQSIIKVKDNAGDYISLVWDGGNAVDNFSIENLTWDQNPEGNLTGDIRVYNGTTVPTINQSQDLFYFSGASTNLRFEKNNIDHCCGVNSVNVTNAAAKNIAFINNRVSFKRGHSTGAADPAGIFNGKTPFYDASIGYFACRNVTGTGNRFYVDDYADFNGGVEIHGVEQTWKNNQFNGLYTAFAVLAPFTAPENQDIANVVVTDNQINRACNAFLMGVPSATIPAKGWTISRNQISIYQGTGHHDSIEARGILLGDSGPSGGLLTDFLCENNQIEFETDTRATSTRYGNALSPRFVGIEVAQQAPARGVKIRNNVVRKAPVQGIKMGFISASSDMKDWEVEKNTFIDCGSNRNIAAAEVGSYCTPLELAGNVLTNVHVEHNEVIYTGEVSAPSALYRVFPLAAAVNSTFGNNSVHWHTGTRPGMYSDAQAGTLIGTVTDGSETIPYAATITPDPLKPSIKYVALTGNITVSAVPSASPGFTSRALAGHRMTFVFTQDPTGGRTVTWDAQYAGMTPMTATQLAPNATSAWEVGFNGTKWNQLSTSIFPALGTAAAKDVGLAVGNVPVIENISGAPKINPILIPGTGKTWVVTDQAAMLALSSAVVGDYALQTGSSPANQLFYLTALPPSTLGNWAGPVATGVSVVTVNGQPGPNPVITTSNVGEGSNLYYTDVRAQAAAPAVTLNAAADAVLGLSTQQLTLDNQNANTIFAGPTTGAAAVPTFRLPVLADFASSVFGTGTPDATTWLRGDRTWQTLPASSATASGIVELATLAEADAQTDTVRAVTPADLANRVFTSRTLNTTAPLAGGGDLTANRTLSITAATSAAAGSMSAADKAKLDGINAFVNAGTVATNYTPDAAAADVYEITLGAATVTINAPTNPTNGRKVLYRLKQDGTGNRAVTWNAVFVGGTDVVTPVLSTGAGKIDYVGTVYDATAVKWHFVATTHGY